MSPESIKWSYELVQTKRGVASKSRSFRELQTDNLHCLCDDLSNHAHSTEAAPVRTLYTSLAMGIQDYPWDAPLLTTPLLPKQRKRKKSVPLHDTSHMTNHVYILSEMFSRETGGVCCYQREIIDEIFPQSVINQLQQKRIFAHVIWIPPSSHQDSSYSNIQILSSHMQLFKGDVIPLSALMTPPLTTPTPNESGNSLLLPPIAYLNKDCPRPLPHPQIHHILCDENKSIFCLLGIYSITSFINLLVDPKVGVSTFHPIGIIRVRDIPLHHLSFKDSVNCIGLVPSDQTTPTSSCHGNKGMLSDRFKNLSFWLGRNNFSLILSTSEREKEEQLVLLQPVTALLSTLTLIAPEYHHWYTTRPVTTCVPATSAPSNEPVTTCVLTTSTLSNEPVTTCVPTVDPVTFNELIISTSLNKLVTSVSLDNEQVTSAPSSEPVTSVPSSEPVTSVLFNEPVTGVLSSEPVTSILSNEPVSSAPSNEPVTSAPSNEPVTSAPSNEPVTSALFNKPVTSVPSSEPVTSAPSNEPVTNAPSIEPVTSAPSNEPIASGSSFPSGSLVYIPVLSYFTREQSELSADVWSSLLNPSSPLHSSLPFTWISMTSWAPLTHSYGISSSLLEQLKDCHSNCEEETSISQKVLSQLQKLYTPNIFLDGCHDDESTDYEAVIATDEPIIFEDVLANLSTNLLAITSSDPLAIMLSMKEHIQTFMSAAAGAVTCQGANATVPLIWAELQEHVLMDDKQLREYHMERNNQEMIKIRYILQILLHFECIKLCAPEPEETDAVTATLVQLLQRLSIIGSPLLMGQILKIILPEYCNSCQSVLKRVFDDLMLPQPSCLSPQSDSHTPSIRNESESDDDDDEDGTAAIRLPHSLEAAFAEEPLQKTLPRHTSFQGPSLSRQISLSTKRKDLSSSKKVRRSLFSRSLSVTDVERKRKSDNREEMKSKRSKKMDVVVMETPVKKQVDNYRLYKLQRTRSKIGMESSSNVTIIEESPQRSFYSSKLKNTHSIQFTTPPYRSGAAASSLLGLNKEPSPAALHSLLHGEWASPLTQTTPTTLTPQSPELFQQQLPPSVDNTQLPSRTYLSSRALMNYYTDESPLKKTPVKGRAGVYNSSNCSSPVTPLRSILKTPDRATPPRATPPGKRVSFGDEVATATSHLPAPEQDSASMMAFSLRTPSKEDVPSNFSGIFRSVL